MSAVLHPPPPEPLAEGDRIGATLILSLLVHALVVLGIGFAMEDAAPVLPTLDVMLTQTQTRLTPKQADFLAQANNQGGGDHDKAQRPRDAQAGRVPQPEDGVAPRPLQAQSPQPQPPPQARVISSLDSPQIVAQPRTTPQADPDALPPGQQKIDHDMEMARLAAEIHLRSQLYARRPTRKFVSASTREYAWAGYLRQWVDRVERVGNLNYPDEARRRHIGGVVVINVGVRRDGSIERADIVVSSHVPMLDAAALRIARLAAPYPPLPKTEEDPDILNVVRTWQFMPGGAMVDR